MLRVSQKAEEAIRRHAEAGYPLEICGFLVGTAEEEFRTAYEAWPVRNAWEDDPELRSQLVAGVAESGDKSAAEWEGASAERRFLVSPQDTIAAMKQAREAKLDLIGVYHTHPNHPAIPSGFDRDAAWPGWSYVIVSVREGEVAEFRSWEIDPDTEQFVEEAIAEE